MNTPLDKALLELSPEQLKVAHWNEGPLLVLAGPGSGKTRGLTARIARILADSPEASFRLLALTFTNLAADEMRLRIQSYVPEAEGRLLVGTFHSFCVDILRQHGAKVGVQSDFRIYSSDEDRKLILKEAVTDELANQLEGEDITNPLPLLDLCRKRLLTPEEIRKNAKIARHYVVADVLEAYEQRLRDINAIDFEALVALTYKLATILPAVPRNLQIAYKYWCIDEFQDTNYSQYALIKALAAPSFRNLLVVADDDQIIYGWNGASYERLKDFRRDFSPEVLQFFRNYRCPSEVVEIANRLVQCNRERSPDKVPLSSSRESASEESVVAVVEAPTESEELESLAAHISDKQSKLKGSWCVLARTGKLLDVASAALTEAGVENKIMKRRDSFQSYVYQWIHGCLRQFVRPADAVNLERMSSALSTELGIQIDTERAITLAHAKEITLLSSWANVVRESGQEAAIRMVGYFEESLCRLGDYVEFEEKVSSYFLNQTREQEDEELQMLQEDSGAWRVLLKEIRSSVGSLPSADQFLQELDLRSKEAPAAPGAVQLMTVHGAKGKEFDHVCVIGLNESVFPSYHAVKKGDDSPEMEEERRSCFVAVTRCMKTLRISFHRKSGSWARKPSRFLSEMGLSNS